MRPGEDHVGLGPQAADLGERRQDGLDQFPGNGPVALGEPTAEDLGQRQNGLPLAVARAGRIEPVTRIAQKVVEALHLTAGMLEEAQITRHPRQHPIFRSLAPQARAEAEGAGVVVGGVAALPARNPVDRMLDQTGAVGHPIEVGEHESAGSVHWASPWRAATSLGAEDSDRTPRGVGRETSAATRLKRSW